MVVPTRFALLAMLAMFGLLVSIAGARGAIPRSRRGASGLEGVAHLGLRVGLGTAGFLVALLVTGWPVVAVYCGVAGVFLPTLAAARRKRREAVERVEAIAIWAESLRDTMAGSAGIQEALRTSGRVAPDPIRTEVRDLALRLQHQSVTRSLRRFAADMNHPLSDMVVASLLLAIARGAGSLQTVLAMVAKAARDSAAMTRRVEAGRARIYSQSRMAGWISFLMIVFLIVARRGFLEPYDSFVGQIALVFIFASFFASGLALYRLGRQSDPSRPFRGIEKWSDSIAADVGAKRS